MSSLTRTYVRAYLNSNVACVEKNSSDACWWSEGKCNLWYFTSPNLLLWWSKYISWKCSTFDYVYVPFKNKQTYAVIMLNISISWLRLMCRCGVFNWLHFEFHMSLTYIITFINFSNRNFFESNKFPQRRNVHAYV